MPFDRPQLQNVRAGVGVFAAIAGGGLLLWLGLWLRSNSYVEYTVTFTPAQGVYGMKKGAPVRVGGIAMGEVQDVEPHVDDGVVSGYSVHFTLKRRIHIYSTARIIAVSTGIGGEAALDIVDVGRGRRIGVPGQTETAAPTPLKSGDSIESQDPAPFDGALGTTAAARLRQLMDQYGTIKAALEHVAQDAPERIARLRGGWKPLAEQLRADFTEWRQHWAAVSMHAESAMVKLGLGSGASADAVVPGMRDVRDQLQQVDLAQAMERATWARATLAGAVDSLDALQAEAFAIRNAINDADSGMGAANADFAIAGAELAAAKAEVLAAPWRLFASPTAPQSARARQVNEARVVAQAATEFEEAIAGCKRALERDHELLRKAPGLAELLATQVRAATEQFDAAMVRLSRVLLQQD